MEGSESGSKNKSILLKILIYPLMTSDQNFFFFFFGLRALQLEQNLMIIV